MESTEQPLHEKKGIHFNIGKAYGLAGEEQKIEDYRKKLDEIATEMRKKLTDEVEEINKSVSGIEDKLIDLHKRMMTRQQEVNDKQGQLFTQLNKHYSNNYENNPRAKEMMEEVLKQGLENFKRSMQVSVSNEKDMAVKIADFSTKISSLLSRAEKVYLDFIRVLEQKTVDFTEMEEGYHHGDAIRISLSGNTDANEA